MSLSSTLTEGVLSNRKKISPENAITYANLSSVHSTMDIINAIMDYSNKYPIYKIKLHGCMHQKLLVRNGLVYNL